MFFLPLSRLAGGLGEHDVCQTQKFISFCEVRRLFYPRIPSVFDRTDISFDKNGKKGERGKGFPGFHPGYDRAKEKGERRKVKGIDSPDFIWATTLDARRSLS